jgi:hypothetical protein
MKPVSATSCRSGPLAPTFRPHPPLFRKQPPLTPPPACLHACRALGIRVTRFLLVIDIARQTTTVFEQKRNPNFGSDTAGVRPRNDGSAYRLRKRLRCSTSKFGIGQIANSNCTPLGLHRIAEKVGGGWPVGAVFRNRRLVGFTWLGLPLAPIAHRIFWLDGLEPGFNRGGNVDSHARYIYIHGTGDEPTLGRPASHGCTHLAANDLLPLYDLLPTGTLVWIQR